MRQCGLRLLSFERLICGSDKHVAALFPNKEVCHKMVGEWQSKTAGAPLPVPLAVYATAHLIQELKCREAVGLLSTHPQRKDITSALSAYIAKSGEQFSYDGLRDTFEMARLAKTLNTTEFLSAFGSFCATDTRVSATQREEARGLILREISFNAHSAHKLFAALCWLSGPSAEHLNDVLGILELSHKDVFIKPTEFKFALELCVACGKHNTVVELWEWMQHTSACWDGEAVSIVVECLCQREDYSRAMECAKALHSVGVRPTAAAQIALVRLHSSKGAPGAAALENLVAHWYSSTNRDSTMWDDEHWRVAVEVLTAYSKANNGVEVTELLRQLHDTRGREYSTWINEVPHRAFVFLLHRKVIREPFARDLCFLNPLHLADLADHPELLSVVILYANYTNSDVFDDLRQLSPNASVFEKVCKFIVEEGGRLSTKEKLDVLGRLSHCWGMEVPSEVKSWLELLGSINK